MIHDIPDGLELEGLPPGIFMATQMVWLEFPRYPEIPSPGGTLLCADSAFDSTLDFWCNAQRRIDRGATTRQSEVSDVFESERLCESLYLF